MAAQRVTRIVAAEQPPILQDRDDVVQEAVEVARAGDVQVEAVDRPGAEPAFDLVGDGFGRTDKGGAPADEAGDGLAQGQPFATPMNSGYC